MNNVKKIREKNKITQEVLAKKMGVARQTISAIECGSNPSVDLLKQLAEYFGVTCDEILGFSTKATSANTA